MFNSVLCSLVVIFVNEILICEVNSNVSSQINAAKTRDNISLWNNEWEIEV